MTMEPGANLLGRELVGILDLAGLPRRWRHLDFLHERALGMSQQGGSAVITPRQVDQARLGGHRLYPNVERALGAARDCDLALRSLLRASWGVAGRDVGAAADPVRGGVLGVMAA